METMAFMVLPSLPVVVAIGVLIWGRTSRRGWLTLGLISLVPFAVMIAVSLRALIASGGDRELSAALLLMPVLGAAVAILLLPRPDIRERFSALPWIVPAVFLLLLGGLVAVSIVLDPTHGIPLHWFFEQRSERVWTAPVYSADRATDAIIAAMLLVVLGAVVSWRRGVTRAIALGVGAALAMVCGSLLHSQGRGARSASRIEFSLGPLTEIERADIAQFAILGDVLYVAGFVILGVAALLTLLATRAALRP